MVRIYLLAGLLLNFLFFCQSACADADPASAPFKTDSAPAIVLPDIPEPVQSDISQLGLQNGVMQLKSSIDGDLFLIKPDFNSAKGVPVDANIVSQEIPATTVGWLLSARPDKTEAVMNMGWRAGGNQQLLFSAAQLRGMVAGLSDGRSGPSLNQTSGGLDYRYFPDQPWLTGLELSGYTSENQGLNPSGDNPTRIAAASLVGMRMGLEAAPFPDVKLKIGIGGERVSFDSLSGSEPVQNLNTSVRWSQILMPTVKYNATLEGKGAERIAATGLDINLYNGQQLGVKLEHTQWSDGQAPDNVVQLTYNIQFGKKFIPFQFRGDNTPWSSSLTNEVLQRPGYLPKSILVSPN